MKIAVCLNKIQPRDGTSHFAMQIGDMLAGAGHDVTMIAARPYALDLQRREPRLAFFSIGQRQWESKAGLIRRIGRHFQEQRFQVVFICAGMPVPDLERALCLLPDETAIVPVLGGDREHVYEPTQRSAPAWNVVVAESPRLQRTIQERVPERDVRLLTTGIVHPSAVELAERVSYSTPLRLIFVGRLDGRKNVYMLPQILAGCVRRGIAVRLTICGNGPDKPSLIQACQDAAVTHLVDFPDIPHQPELYAAYRQHHALLWTSSYGEGLGLVLLEAQANGCVPVASRLLGVTDFTLADGETGLLAEEQDVDDFVKQIAALTDPDRWQRLSSAGIARTRRLFSLEAMRREYGALLDEIGQGLYPLPASRSTLPRPRFGYKEHVPPALHPIVAPLFRAARKLARFVRRSGSNPARTALPTPAMKEQTLRQYASRYNLRVLVETGTCFGDTVEAMKHDFDTIYSIELSGKLFYEAKERFKTSSHIELMHGDSGKVLKVVMERLDRPALFWLDAHYSGGSLRGKVTARGEKDTPILEELEHILAAHSSGHVIIIDDARCFGTDPAYPTIAELNAFVRSRREDLGIVIEDDSIRITPLP
jgi:glycosyltransferase involved in cell wall biosynthesis